MTLLDAVNTMSNNQAVTVTAASTDVLDFGAVNRDIAAGEELYLIVSVGTTVTAAGAATVDFALQTDSVVGFGSAVTLFSILAVPKATLVAGYYVTQIVIPRYTKRYLRMNYTVATGPLTAGTFYAFITARAADDAARMFTYPRSSFGVA